MSLPTSRAQEPSIEHMVGQMIMVGFKGTTTSDPDVALLVTAIKQEQLGGVILFDRDARTKERGRNITSVTQVQALSTALQKAAKTPLFISIDQEGGKVQRLRKEHGAKDVPSPQYLGKHDATGKNSYIAWKDAAKVLQNAGINLNFAPGVDLNSNPKSPAIGAVERAYSEKTPVVVAHATHVIKALQEQQVIVCLKHFPGHGSATQDTHKGMADITKTWSANELEPYKKLIASKTITPTNAMVMIGHLTHNGIDANNPASLSSTVITQLLRQKLQ